MWPLAVAVLALAVASGCGSGEPTDGARSPEGAPTPPSPGTILRPPDIQVVSAAGVQEAAPGKSCVLTVAQGRGEGDAECIIPERRVRAHAFTVARPKETIAIRLVDASIIRRPGCSDPRECGGWATLRRAGCDRELASFPLRRAVTRWRVTVPPGTYELELSVDFETRDALTGDASAVAGLVVDPRRRRAVVPGVRTASGCG